MKYAVLFPGQGSQFIGMCPDVRATYRDLCGASANDVLGWNLDSLIDSGTEEGLRGTRYAQPALYAISYALWVEFSSIIGTQPVAACGHSLGEYTALAASGALEYFDGLRLVSERGSAMAEAAKKDAAGMVALLVSDISIVESSLRERTDAGWSLSIANYNSPNQVVVAGGDDGLEWIADNAKDLGVRRSIRLKVSGAFHSPYMEPATKRLERALGATTFSETRFDVIANSTALQITDPQETLLEQLTSPVRFTESIECMAASGVDTFVHIGPGDVTAGLVKRTLKGSTVKVISSIEDARRVADELSEES